MSVPDIIVGKFVLTSSDNAALVAHGDSWKLVRKNTGVWLSDIERIIFST